MKNNKRGNYFIIDREIFGMELKPGELTVYAYLRSCANIKTGQCWPSYETIAKAANMSKGSVERHVKALEEKGLIMTEHTYWTDQYGNKRNGHLVFTVYSASEVFEENYRRQLDQAEAAAERQRVREKLQAQQEA